MSFTYINTGTSPNKGDGDTLRLAFGKINNNFLEISTGMYYLTTSSDVTFNSLTLTGDLLVQGTSTVITDIITDDLTLTLAYNSTSTSTSNGAGIIINGPTIPVEFTFNSDTEEMNLNKVLTAEGVMTTGTMSIGYEPGPLYPNTNLNINWDVDDFGQVLLQNHNSGMSASADLVLMNDIGTNDENYIDLGINSSNYSVPSYSVTQPGDGYLYVNGNNLTIGTQSPGTSLKFHAGGSTYADAVGSVDAYAWRFNRSVQTIVSAPGPLNFTVKNSADNSAAIAVYQAINDVDGYLQLGIQSSNAGALDGNIGPGESFLHTHEASNNIHIGRYSNLYFYTNSSTGYAGTASLAISNIDQSSTFSGNVKPHSNLAYDLGTTSTQWRSLYVGNAKLTNGGLTFSDGTTQTTAFNLLSTIPASSTSTGIKGQIAVSTSSLYVCVATNTWLKFNGVTF